MEELQTRCLSCPVREIRESRSVAESRMNHEGICKARVERNSIWLSRLDVYVTGFQDPGMTIWTG